LENKNQNLGTKIALYGVISIIVTLVKRFATSKLL